MASGTHRVPAGFMLPVIIAAADHQSLLRPDDLGADGKVLTDQTFGNRPGMQRGVPDIRDVAGEERPGGGPVRALVVRYFANTRGLVDAALMSPVRVIVHAIGRVGDHELRLVGERAGYSL